MILRAGSLAALLALTLAGVSSCALIAPPAWRQPPPPVADRPVVDAQRLHRATLDNGLRILVLEDHRLPRIAVGLTVRRGAASESPAEAGAAVYSAELMQRGAGTMDALALARRVDALGGELDVSAEWDAMSVGVSGLSNDLAPLFEVMCDVALRPRFAPAEAQRARAEQLGALEGQKDDPATLARRQLARALYDGHRFGLPVEGAPESVARLDAAAARAFHARVFVPSNAIVYAVGDVDPEDFVARVRAGLGDWTGAAAPPAPAPPPARTPEARRVVIVDRPELGQAQISLGHEGIARSDPDRFAVSLLNNVVGGGGFSSRLMSTVRSEAGLTYSVGSGFALRRAPGPFAVSTFTRVPEVGRVIDLLLAELERARTSPPTEAELGDAKSELVGGFALGLETSEAIAASLVSLDVQGLPEDSLDTFRGRVRAVTTADTADAARTRLHPARAAIVVVGPADALRLQLERLGPVEVVQP
jgi:zinc protease